MKARLPDLIAVLERRLKAVDDAVLECASDYGRLSSMRAEAESRGENALAGKFSAHMTLTGMRWSEALGARAELEAVYQELVGQPSPGHMATSRVLEAYGLCHDPVGLRARRADTAELLALPGWFGSGVAVGGES